MSEFQVQLIRPKQKAPTQLQWLYLSPAVSFTPVFLRKEKAVWTMWTSYRRKFSRRATKTWLSKCLSEDVTSCNFCRYSSYDWINVRSSTSQDASCTFQELVINMPLYRLYLTSSSIVMQILNVILLSTVMGFIFLYSFELCFRDFLSLEFLKKE